MYQCPPGSYPYRVKTGDSLWRIAQRFHTTVKEIAVANPALDVNKIYRGQIICIPDHNSQIPMQHNSKFNGTKNQALHDQMRLLWEQHIYWTRMVILSIVFGLPDEKYVTKRLLRNPTDFKEALKVFYNDDIAEMFEELFTNHLVIAAELVKAAKSGDHTAAADAENRWYANADQIAGFLGSINPYWHAQEWQEMLYDHLAMTKSEAVYIIDGKYEDSIIIFEKIEKEALMMADVMSQGLTKQFPCHFA